MKMNFANPKADFTFKRLFGSNGHKNLTISLLNNILGRTKTKENISTHFIFKGRSMHIIRYILLLCLSAGSTMYSSNDPVEKIAQTVFPGGEYECCKAGQGVSVCLIATMPSIATPVTVNVGCATTSCSVPPVIPVALGCCIMAKAGYNYAEISEDKKKKGSVCRKAGCFFCGGWYAMSFARLCKPGCTTAVYCYDAMVK